MSPRLLAFVLLLSPVLAADPPLLPLPLDQGANGLGLALRRLGVTGRVLYVTAHPDDEHNGVLVALSRGRGVRTGLLTLTRGEGGQNEIGPELFDALAVLRTEELAAIHRYDGVDQLFGRAVDFGYSFSVAETLSKWGHEATLGDVVRAVRSFRPDVILTLPLEGGSGGLHHQAAARLAREAFRAAADPARFPEHLTAGLRPWQARKVYQGGVGGGADPLPGPPPLVMTTGRYDALLGMTWQELGSLSRASHRSQGAGQLKASPGEGQGAYALVDAVEPPRTSETDIFDGIDTSVAGLVRVVGGEPSAPWLAPALASLQVQAGTLQANLDPRAPHERAAPLAAYLDAVRTLRNRVAAAALPDEARALLAFRLEDEERDVVSALVLAHALAFEAVADDGDVVPGQAFGVKATVWNEGGAPLRIDGVDLRVPDGWTATPRPVAAEVAEDAQGVSTAFEVRAAESARYSQPYWSRPPDAGRVLLLVPEHEGLPWSPPEVVARLRFTSHGVATTLEQPVVWRYKAGGGGEKRKVVNVVPLLSARVSPAMTVVPVAGTATRREVKLAVLSNAPGPVTATARLEVPAGWTVTPPQTQLEFRNEGEEVAARFEVAPPARPAPGAYDLRAVVAVAGREFREGYQAIAYDHVQERHVFRPATVRAVALDVRVAPGTAVGYVMGTGDEVAEAVRQLGVPVATLGPDDLAFGDLDRYSTIVTGIRAYQVRPDLRSYHRRLMSYVEAGGNLVVQYNRRDFNQLADPRAATSAPAAEEAGSPFAPYPAAVTASRVTDETAPLRVLLPDSALLREPNPLGAADWDGWVQERGLQLLGTRDTRYADVIAMSDPFPENAGEKRGALVEARVGRGTWTYVGLSLFRQLPAGVPGAYRLLANLVSRPRG